jgi:hypothetical protein
MRGMEPGGYVPLKRLWNIPKSLGIWYAKG